MTKYETALEEMNSMIKQHRWIHDRDPDMLLMYKNDRNDFRSIVRFLKRGDWKSAYDLAGSLDTAARDCIPGPAWEFMNAMYDNFIDPDYF